MAWSWSDVGNAVADVAPTIAGVLGNIVLPGAGGIVAAAATTALLEALDLGDRDPQDPATIDAAQAKIASANPELMLRLREQDQKFQKDMADIGVRLEELGVRREEIYASDRANARQRQIVVKDTTPAILAYVTVTSFLITAGAIISMAIAGHLELGPVASGLVGTVVGGVIAKTSDVFQYYFGSSRSSAQKDETIHAQAQSAAKEMRN